MEPENEAFVDSPLGVVHDDDQDELEEVLALLQKGDDELASLREDGDEPFELEATMDPKTRDTRHEVPSCNHSLNSSRQKLHRIPLCHTTHHYVIIDIIIVP